MNTKIKKEKRFILMDGTIGLIANRNIPMCEVPYNIRKNLHHVEYYLNGKEVNSWDI